MSLRQGRRPCGTVVKQRFGIGSDAFVRVSARSANSQAREPLQSEVTSSLHFALKHSDIKSRAHRRCTTLKLYRGCCTVSVQVIVQ